MLAPTLFLLQASPATGGSAGLCLPCLLARPHFANARHQSLPACASCCTRQPLNPRRRLQVMQPWLDMPVPFEGCILCMLAHCRVRTYNLRLLSCAGQATAAAVPADPTPHTATDTPAPASWGTAAMCMFTNSNTFQAAPILGKGDRFCAMMQANQPDRGRSCPQLPAVRQPCTCPHVFCMLVHKRSI